MVCLRRTSGKRRARALVCGAVFAAALPNASAESGRRPPASALAYCDAMSASFADKTSAAALIVSYDVPPDRQTREPGLWNVAFVYDNALAAIAFVACGRLPEARRIADALVAAINGDRSYQDGRIRNAYRAGAIASGAPALPGWWDPQLQRRLEDAQHVGTTTGNAAWAALALLTVSAAINESQYRNAAATVMGWVAKFSCDDGATGAPAFGFPGGFHGPEPDQVPLTWKSTEHNIDAFAAFAWLAAREPQAPDRAAGWQRCARVARDFVAAMFDERIGRFRLGTGADGRTPVDSGSGLDAQLWPILVLGDDEPAWQRALAWAEQHHGVPGGFDFNDDRDGLWVEGTAQAALVYKVLGMTQRADELLLEIANDVAPSGLLYASRIPVLTTGLALGPQSTSPDFVYQRLPHLGATAWAALAAVGWNPLTGRDVRNRSRG